MSRSSRSVKVKQENEIQSYINSFKEIEEPDDEPSTSGGSKKVFISSDHLETEEFEQIIVREDQSAEEDYKYVFIVQDEDEDGGEGEEKVEDGEIYEFDELEEEALEEADDKSKIVKVISSSSKKPTGVSAGAGGAGIHACAYCSYNTPKRYLLARHMKCHSEDR